MKFASKDLLRFAVVASFACALVLMLTVSVVPTKADILDPLHGYCGGAGQCIDNGTNSPTTNNPPVNFGFTVSPGPASGVALTFDILEPNNEAHAPVSLTGTFAGTAALFSATAWTSGDLDTYLGISASPANPIGAFLPSTQALDPGATGFFVYQFTASPSLGITLQSPSNPGLSPLENIGGGGGLPLGGYVIGFFNEGTAAAPNWIATANSGAIFEDAPPTSMTPEPGTLLLFGSGLLGIAGLIRKRIS